MRTPLRKMTDTPAAMQCGQAQIEGGGLDGNPFNPASQ